ncbi:MAG: hypothetical protein ACC618_00335 [Patescibacteria group bacterium]
MTKKQKTLIISLAATAIVIFVAVSILRNTINNSTGLVGTDDTQEFEEQEEGVAGEAEIPSNFPKDFPIYLEAKLDSVYTSKGEEIEAISVIWVTNASLNEVSEFYRSGLENSGWEVELVLEDDESTTYTFKRGEAFGFLGIGRNDEDTTTISVTVGASFERPTL